MLVNRLARGRLLKTIKKEAKEVAKVEAKQYFEQYFKASDRHFFTTLKNKAANMIENIDPIEAIAVIGGAIAVHDIIFKADDFVQQVSVWKDSELVQTKIIAAMDFFGIPVGSVVLDILHSLAPEQFKKAYGEKPNYQPPSFTGELATWLVAIAISYFAFKHGGDLINIAKSFFGAIAVAIA